MAELLHCCNYLCPNNALPDSRYCDRCVERPPKRSSEGLIELYERRIRDTCTYLRDVLYSADSGEKGQVAERAIRMLEGKR